MRPNHWLLGLALLHAGVLGAPASTGGMPEFLHWTVAFRMKDDPQAKKGGIVEATLSCTKGRCFLSEIVVTECSGNPSGFYIFAFNTADDEAENVFHGFEGRDRQSGFITVEMGRSNPERTTYRFDYVRDGSGKLRLTGASRADVRAGSRVTGKIETAEWVPLPGALTIFNPGCGFRTFGIENAEGKKGLGGKGGRDGS